MRKRRPNPKFIKQVPGVPPEARKDAGKDHIIITERKDEKASKYQIKGLPYPYTSEAQFEKLLETPIGREWNTQTFFRKNTLPRILTKVCLSIICPMPELSIK